MRSYAKSIELYERTRKTLAGGVSSNVRYAATPVLLFFARGEGPYLYDVDGNVHIDYYWATPRPSWAIRPSPSSMPSRDLALEKVYAAQHPRETEFAERLEDLLPGISAQRFATSGTEVALMPFRLARAKTGRVQS